MKSYDPSLGYAGEYDGGLIGGYSDDLTLGHGGYNGYEGDIYIATPYAVPLYEAPKLAYGDRVSGSVHRQPVHRQLVHRKPVHRQDSSPTRRFTDTQFNDRTVRRQADPPTPSSPTGDSMTPNSPTGDSMAPNSPTGDTMTPNPPTPNSPTNEFFRNSV